MRPPTKRDLCFQCGNSFDEDKPDWVKIGTDPPRFAHYACVQGKMFRIPGKPGKPGEAMQASVLIAIGGANHSEPPDEIHNEPVAANWTWDFEKETEADRTPVALFILCNLLDANKQRVEQIRFEMIPGAKGRSDRLVVFFEKDGISREYERHTLEHYRKSAGLTQARLWQMIVRRLKILARMVDDGPSPSTHGDLVLRISSKNRTIAFHMPGNPNPYVDKQVTLIAR